MSVLNGRAQRATRTFNSQRDAMRNENGDEFLEKIVTNRRTTARVFHDRSKTTAEKACNGNTPIYRVLLWTRIKKDFVRDPIIRRVSTNTLKKNLTSEPNSAWSSSFVRSFVSAFFSFYCKQRGEISLFHTSLGVLRIRMDIDKIYLDAITKLKNLEKTWQQY